MSQSQKFVCDKGEVEIVGFKVAEVRENDWAIIAVACDYHNGGCHALHMHLLTEDSDGELTCVTTLDSTDQEAIARSGFLFRAILMLVHGVLDAELCLPKDQPAEEEEKGGGFREVIPGLTPWGKA